MQHKVLLPPLDTIETIALYFFEHTFMKKVRILFHSFIRFCHHTHEYINVKKSYVHAKNFCFTTQYTEKRGDFIFIVCMNEKVSGSLTNKPRR